MCVVFRYKKDIYNVLEVNKLSYDKCIIEGVVGNWSNGKDFIFLKKVGKYYFICGNDGCFSGMKVFIFVYLFFLLFFVFIVVIKYFFVIIDFFKFAVMDVILGWLVVVVYGVLFVSFVVFILIM